MPARSPARFLPLPMSTMVPTSERTIWWQKALASISHRSTPSPVSSPRAACHRANGWPQHAVHGTLEAGQVETELLGVEAHHLAPGVHAPVRPTRARELDGVAEHLADGSGEGAADGLDPLLSSEAVEASAVVGQRHA